MEHTVYVTYDYGHHSLDVWKEEPELHNPDWIMQLASLREMINSDSRLVELAKDHSPIKIKLTIETDE
jgi:hypothetical protein